MFINSNMKNINEKLHFSDEELDKVMKQLSNGIAIGGFFQTIVLLDTIEERQKLQEKQKSFWQKLKNLF